MERWGDGAMRALAIAADGVTKRCMPAAVRERACTPNWRAGRPCRIAPATQNNSTSGMVKPRAALPAKGGDQRGISAMAATCISAVGMGVPAAQSWRVAHWLSWRRAWDGDGAQSFCERDSHVP